MSLDPNVIMSKTDAPLWLWQQYPYRHNYPYRISFPLYVYVNLCTNATSVFLLCSFSHTLSFSVSPLASSLSPPLRFAYKPLAILFMLSLIAIKSSDKHCCFTQRAEHNFIIIPEIGISMISIIIKSKMSCHWSQKMSPGQMFFGQKSLLAQDWSEFSSKLPPF